jgi:tRNA-dihydrouridine synthase
MIRLFNNIMSLDFILAPMAELSHRPLRELIENVNNSQNSLYGASAVKSSVLYFTEMISAAALTGGGPYESWYMDNGPCPHRLVYQLVGGDEDQLVKAAGLLDKKDCLGIDINMGCSAPAITRTGAGVRWMADIDRAGALIAKARRVIKRRLSVKLRIGLTDDFEYLVRFCRRLEEEGVDFITLHP